MGTPRQLPTKVGPMSPTDRSAKPEAIDIDAVRSDTPGCREVIHLNNAGASLPPKVVIDAVQNYFRSEAMLGGYETFDAHAPAMEAVYSSAAELLGCQREEVAVTGSSSEAWWRAFTSVPLEARDRVLIGRSEFVSSAAGLFQAAERGVELAMIDTGPDGLLDLDQLESLLDERVKLICLTEVPMTQGVINPIAEAVAICRQSCDAIVIVDGTQAVGQLPVDVAALGCDFYTATGRKWLRGPRGTGLLFASTDVLDRMHPPIFVDGAAGAWVGERTFIPADGAKRFEFGERPYANVAGLGAAIDYALTIGLEAIETRVGTLAAYARQQLEAIPAVAVHDNVGPRCGIVSFTLDGIDPGDVVTRLRQVKIHLAAPGTRASYFDLVDRDLQAIVRVAPHYYNTEQEIDAMVAELGKWQR